MTDVSNRHLEESLAIHSLLGRGHQMYGREFSRIGVGENR